MTQNIRIGPYSITPLRPGMPIMTLAPMAGISNWPFRLICARMGARMVGVEFINCNAILHKNLKTELMMDFCDVDMYRNTGHSVLAAQIYGNDIETMVEGAKVLEDRGAQIMDINFGCSVPKILRSDSGAAFLKDIDRMMNAVYRVAKALSIPVIIKTRLGWDHQNISILEVVKRAADSGAHAVAVHARTVGQKFNGQADWSWIARAVEVSQVPIFGNGDVFTYQEAIRMVKETNCAGVMIARAARDNPWIFSGDGVPDFLERVEMAKDHLQMMVEYKGEKIGVLEMRKFFASYFKGFPNASHLRSALVQVDTIAQAHEILDLWETRVPESTSKDLESQRLLPQSETSSLSGKPADADVAGIAVSPSA
jgi:tRNA-dihydrouridine synthase B